VPRGDALYCQWKHKDQPYFVSLDTTSKKDAEVARKILMAQVIAAITDGTFHEKFAKHKKNVPIVVNGDISLARAWDAYVQSSTRPDTSGDTLRQYSYQFSKFVEWVNAHHPEIKTISKVDKVVAREYATSLQPTVGNGTYNKYVNLLKLVFRVLLETLDIEANPWRNIQHKQVVTMGKLPFTAVEIETILAKATGEIRTLCLLGKNTGFRLKDCVLLDWSEVDLEKRLIKHVPYKTRRRKPKVKATAYISDELYAHLCQLKKTATGERVCPDSASSYLRNLGEFCKAIQKFFSTTCGINVHHEERGCRNRALASKGFHSFRHYYFTTAHEAETASQGINAMAGWSSSAMQGVYTHPSDEHIISMGKRIEQVALSRRSAQPVATPDVTGIPDDELARTVKALQDELERRKKAS